MRLLGLLLAIPLAVQADPLAQADRLSAAWPQAKGEERTKLLVDAANVPWPALPAELETQVATHLHELPVAARRAWALDRALPLLAGDIAAPDDFLADVLKELRGTASHSKGHLPSMEEARTAYQHGDMESAITRYDSVTRDSTLWPEALREQAWALFVADEPARALGATVSLAAPYFAAEDHAEGRLLEAMVLVAKCRFAEARERVKDLAEWNAPAPTLDAARAAFAAAKAPEGEAGQRAWDSVLVRRVRRVLEASKTQGNRREAVVSTGARILLDAWNAEREAARDLSERALQVRYDALRGERRLLEKGVKLGEPRTASAGPLDDDEVAWSFDGTYWRDELGTYRYLVGDACPTEKAP